MIYSTHVKPLQVQGSKLGYSNNYTSNVHTSPLLNFVIVLVIKGSISACIIITSLSNLTSSSVNLNSVCKKIEDSYLSHQMMWILMFDTMSIISLEASSIIKIPLSL